MSLTSAALIGVQSPRVELVPKTGACPDGEDAAYLSAKYGLDPFEWQRRVLAGWLGQRPNGRWAATRCGLAVPRQNGKNAVVEMRQLYGMLVLGERFLHTAHQVKTASKAFQRLLYFFDNPRMFPKLHARTTMVRKANGQEAVFLDNGGSFELAARSKGAGRGFSVDVLILDEAEELSSDALAALKPTISASPNPQTIYTGTPPSPVHQGEIWTRVREAGLAGVDERLCWQEWGCLSDADLADPVGWGQANPSMGLLIDPETIADEYADFDDATFGRERLGMWSDPTTSRIISVDSWRVCGEPNLIDGGGVVAFAIDVAPDRGSCSICAASWTAGGLPFVDVVESRRGEPDWGVAKIASMCDRHDVRAVVIDAAGPAGSLVDPLRQAGITVTVTTARQMAAAWGGFYDAVMDGRLRHMDQPLLNVALSVARKRPIGDTGWGWSRKDSDADISPLTAATLSLWGLVSSEIEEKPRIRSGRAVFV
jgi:phage terminase large subunit-like protein